MSSYNLDEYLRPIWRGDIMCNESICFFPNSDTGEVEPAPLLYNPTEIISVTSADLKTVFKEGEDFVIKDGAVCLTSDSAMKAWEYDEYYTTDPGLFEIGWIKPEGRYVNWARGSFHADHQYAVTYKHDGVWNGPEICYAGEKLKKTVEKLEKGENLRVLFYGDSITEGSDASGFSGDFDGAFEPYMPIYPELVVNRLEKRYPKCKIEYINTAVGGWGSTDGVNAAAERVTAHKADLVVIGFGMNDLKLDAKQHKENILKIMEAATEANPNAEFILIATTLPNPDSKWSKHQLETFTPVLREIENERTGVAVAPMTEMHKFLMSKKRYSDMSGNGINHPNDFLVRVYVQTLTALLICE